MQDEVPDGAKLLNLRHVLERAQQVAANTHARRKAPAQQPLRQVGLCTTRWRMQGKPGRLAIANGQERQIGRGGGGTTHHAVPQRHVLGRVQVGDEAEEEVDGLLHQCIVLEEPLLALGGTKHLWCGMK